MSQSSCGHSADGRHPCSCCCGFERSGASSVLTDGKAGDDPDEGDDKKAGSGGVAMVWPAAVIENMEYIHEMVREGAVATCPRDPRRSAVMVSRRSGLPRSSRR